MTTTPQRTPKKTNAITVADIIQVIDNKHNKVIAKGQVHYEKVTTGFSDSGAMGVLTKDKKLISIDNKTFFKLDSDNYRIEKLDPFFVNENFIKQNYTTKKWSEYKESNRNNTDIYIENNILELDQEVENLVHTLNRFSPHMTTTGSCSGHGKKRAWISLTFESSRALIDFIDVFDPYKEQIDFTTDPHMYPQKKSFCEKPFFPRNTVLTLKTKEIGQPAYEILEEFNNYLDSIIKLRNKSNESEDELMTQERMRLRAKQRKHLSTGDAQ